MSASDTGSEGTNMGTRIDIPRTAREWGAPGKAASPAHVCATSLIAAALRIDDLEIEHYEPGSIVDKGVLGFLERNSRLINIASNLDPKDEVVVTTHEK